MAVTVGGRCKAVILTGGPERERKKKYMVSVFSISDQTDSDHQCSTKTTYPNKWDGKLGFCWELFPWEGTFHKDPSLPWCIHKLCQIDKNSISITHQSLYLWYRTKALWRKIAIYFPCHQAWRSHFTFVSGSNFTTTRGCALVKNSPHVFVRWHSSFSQLLLLKGLCANALQGSPEPCKSFEVFRFLLKRYPAALTLTFFFTSPMSLNCSSSWPGESANHSCSWGI